MCKLVIWEISFALEESIKCIGTSGTKEPYNFQDHRVVAVMKAGQIGNMVLWR